MPEKGFLICPPLNTGDPAHPRILSESQRDVLSSLDGLRDSLVFLAGLCQQGRVCKVASGFSLPAPPPLFWVGPWTGLCSLKELLALPCECWNARMSSLSRKCLAHRVYSCNVLLPPALTPALPSDSWTFGPRAASAGPVATAFSRLLTHSLCLPFPLSSTPRSCHPASHTCFAS